MTLGMVLVCCGDGFKDLDWGGGWGLLDVVAAESGGGRRRRRRRRTRRRGRRRGEVATTQIWSVGKGEEERVMIGF